MKLAHGWNPANLAGMPFSILERIDVGETDVGHIVGAMSVPFSILERIDVGETSSRRSVGGLGR